MVKMSSITGWVVGLVVLSCVVTGFAIAASDSDTPAATDTSTVGQISVAGGTLSGGGAGGAGGAAGSAGGGATGGGGADVRVAQY